MLLQQPTVSRSTDGFGSPSESWSTGELIYAARKNVGSGREFLVGEQPRHEHRIVWRIYFREDVTSRSRFVEADQAGRIWDIHSAIDPDGARQYLDCAAVMREQGQGNK